VPIALSATPASHSALSAVQDPVNVGTYPGATTYPGADVYPGRGNDLVALTATTTALSEVPA